MSQAITYCPPPPQPSLFSKPHKKKEEKRNTHSITVEGGRTVHLALVRQDDFPTATGRIDGQGLLEALLDVRAPYALRIILQGFV